MLFVDCFRMLLLNHWGSFYFLESIAQVELFLPYFLISDFLGGTLLPLLSLGSNSFLSSLNFSHNIIFHADTDTLQKGMLIDPCIPKGYSYTGPWQLLPGSLDSRNKNISSIQSGGNFSECRSAAVKLLQKGKGPKFTSYSRSFFNENSLLLLCV